MPERRWFRNDFPRVTYVVLGILIGTNALFNSVSQPLWMALNVLVIAVSFGLAIANAVGLVLRRRHRKHTSSHSPNQ